MHYPEQWNLECFFSGGSESLSFAAILKQLGKEIAALSALQSKETAILLVEKMQQAELQLRECDAFIACLQAQNPSDTRANQLRADFSSMDAQFTLFNNRFDDWLGSLDLKTYNTLLNTPECQPIRFILQERMLRASQKLPLESEDLITELSVDGYHAWGDLYPSLVQEITLPFEKEILSFGQAENKLSHPDRKVREKVFLDLEKCWKEKGEIFASVLNHIAGFRLRVYAQRDWESPLKEPLFQNRMSQETLTAMWDAVEQFRGPLLEYMQIKAHLLGLEKLSWYDVDAPLFAASSEKIPYAKAVELIIEKFSAFHPRMGEFARTACSQKWVEAEDRPGKRPGGFCVAFPKSKESRIFMTYSGTMDNVSTLAHELGHAYHNAMVDDLPSLAQQYRMNVAETASTFAEQIVSDALLQQCQTREEKLRILADRIERSLTFFMNIQARFLFETQFYALRKEKFLTASDLCALMQKAQETAYAGALSTYHPYFWAAKMHFYFTTDPFYNFPYTFGYLFSLGLYSRAKQQGASFGASYDALLRETGMMTVEDLAHKHLGVDLTQKAFWLKAAESVATDLAAFKALL